jgi:hypothetical protein
MNLRTGSWVLAFQILRYKEGKMEGEERERYKEGKDR